MATHRFVYSPAAAVVVVVVAVADGAGFAVVVVVEQLRLYCHHRHCRPCTGRIEYGVL